MPILYKHGQRNREFNLSIFVWEMLYAFFNSAVCFFIPFGLFAVNELGRPDGKTYGFWDYGFYTFTWAVLVSNLRIYMEASFIHWSVHASVWLSILVFVGFELLYHIPRVTIASGEPEQMGIIYGIFDTWTFWLELMIVVAVCLLPLCCWRLYNRFWNPEAFHIVQELEYLDKVPDSTSQTFSKMLDNDASRPGPPLTAYYMNEVNRQTGDMGRPHKILGFGFSQSGGQMKWLDRIVDKINTRKRKKKLEKLQKAQRSLVPSSSSEGTERTASTSSTDSTSETEPEDVISGSPFTPMTVVGLRERSSSSTDAMSADKLNVLLEDSSMESI